MSIRLAPGTGDYRGMRAASRVARQGDRARRSAVRLTSGVVAVALVVSACSDSPASGDADGYTVMAIGPFTASAALPTPFPEIEVGAEAAANAINDAGGVNGKPITVVGCDTRAEPNEATKCAQQAVRDGVQAVVAAFDFKGDYIAVLERAGIPVLAPFSQSVELTSKVAYPVNGGSPTLLAGEISLLATKGARDISFVAPAAAVEGDDLAALWQPVIEHFPGLRVQLITAPSEATDLSAVAQKASKGDALGIALQAGQFVPFMKAFRQTSSSIKLIGTDSGTLDASIVRTLGDEVEGVLAANNYLPPTTDGNEAVDAYKDAVDAIDPEGPKNDFSVLGYLGVQLFAQAADGLSEVTGESLREVLDSGREFELGLVPPISFTDPSTAIEGTSRMFNTAVVYSELRDGAFVPIDGTFVDAYTGRPVG